MKINNLCKSGQLKVIIKSTKTQLDKIKKGVIYWLI